ncbi:MAG: hypothetical protein FJ387_27795 [Verrucomicrobia bacterium]|nr:hypothetical protein [Verrucomicrobiota bacterium]
MGDRVPILVPRESVNDDFVTLAAWRVGAGDWVRRGDALADLETSKATVTVEAPCDGQIEVEQPEGTEVPVGATLGFIRPDPVQTARTDKPSPAPAELAAAEPALPAGEGANRGAAGGTDSAANEGSSPLCSQKALELMAEHELSLDLFQGKTFVKESDVRQYLATRAADPAAGPREPVPDPEPAAHVMSTPASPGVPAAGPSRTGFLAEATASARDRGRGVWWVVLNYCFRNYVLNLLVRGMPWGLILWVHRLRGVKIGKGCFVDPTAELETAYPENITLGNDVRVTAHAVIMTHIKAPHYLREAGFVPLTLKPVVLEDHCFIGVNAVIMPGVRVGKAAVVASGAVVLNDVPPFCLVAGNPAKVVKRFHLRPEDSAAPSS